MGSGEAGLQHGEGLAESGVMRGDCFLEDRGVAGWGEGETVLG